MMRTKAPVAAVMALVCLQLCAVPLLARPTRSLARPNAGRLIVAQTTQRPTHERAAHKTASAHASAAHLRAHAAARATASGPRDTRIAANPSRYAGPTAPHSIVTRHASAPTLASKPEADRVHAGMRSREEQQRSLAAHNAIAAADRGIRAPRAERAERMEARAARSAPILAAQHRPAASRLPANSTATGDGPDLDNASALINVGGVLRPATGSAPVQLRLPSIEEEAATPVLLPPLRVSSLYDSRGHLMVPPPLFGSHENLLHQNQMADLDGLNRVRDDADLLDLRRQHKLVALPENEALQVDTRLPEDRRFSRPWTAAFLSVLARDHYAAFHQPLKVDSAVRTVAFQQRLTHRNANAAPSSGDTASPHLTGQAVDIAKRGLTITEIAWMRAYLQPLIDQGKIDVEEEFQQACFHISVYRSFVPAAPARVTLAAAR
jgi:Family of unknown function (DUF5715)